jgi:hypothetical protein
MNMSTLAHRQTVPGGAGASEAPVPRPSAALKVGLVLGLIVLGGVGGYVGYDYYQSTLRPPWLFRGAYAYYVMNTTNFGSGPGPWAIITEVRVLDYNSTAVEMLYHSYEIDPCAGTVLNSSCYYDDLNITRWVSISAAPTFAPLVSSLGANLTGPYNATVSLNNHQYAVEAYRYQSGQGLFYVYVYPKVGFPIALGSSETIYPQSYVSYVSLTRTNIPGLPTSVSTTS